MLARDRRPARRRHDHVGGAARRHREHYAAAFPDVSCQHPRSTCRSWVTRPSRRSLSKAGRGRVRRASRRPPVTDQDHQDLHRRLRRRQRGRDADVRAGRGSAAYVGFERFLGSLHRPPAPSCSPHRVRLRRAARHSGRSCPTPARTSSPASAAPVRSSSPRTARAPGAGRRTGLSSNFRRHGSAHDQHDDATAPDPADERERLRSIADYGIIGSPRCRTCRRSSSSPPTSAACPPRSSTSSPRPPAPDRRLRLRRGRLRLRGLDVRDQHRRAGTVVVRDATLDARFRRNPFVTGENRRRALLRLRAPARPGRPRPGHLCASTSSRTTSPSSSAKASTSWPAWSWTFWTCTGTGSCWSRPSTRVSAPAASCNAPTPRCSTSPARSATT